MQTQNLQDIPLKRVHCSCRPKFCTYRLFAPLVVFQCWSGIPSFLLDFRGALKFQGPPVRLWLQPGTNRHSMPVFICMVLCHTCRSSSSSTGLRALKSQQEPLGQWPLATSNAGQVDHDYKRYREINVLFKMIMQRMRQAV
jgi:hypothetical protein